MCGTASAARGAIPPACFGELTEQRALNTEGGIRFEEVSVVVTSADGLVYRPACSADRPACIAGRRGCPIAGAADDMDQRPCAVRDRIDRCRWKTDRYLRELRTQLHLRRPGVPGDRMDGRGKDLICRAAEKSGQL